MSQVLAQAFPSNAPDRVECNEDNTEMRLVWQLQPDLETSIGIRADKLRAACKCAHCIRARYDGRFPDRFVGISVTEITFMGNFGINVAFSDGHARGIYPWPYLQEIVGGAAHLRLTRTSPSPATTSMILPCPRRP